VSDVEEALQSGFVPVELAQPKDESNASASKCAYAYRYPRPLHLTLDV
jgi:hypothetical protein